MKRGLIDMEDIIKMVLSIDQKATSILKETNDTLGKKESDIHKKIETMKLEIIENAKNESKILLESSIKEAELEAENIRNRTKEESDKLETKFMAMKVKLESQLFSQIFSE